MDGDHVKKASVPGRELRPPERGRAPAPGGGRAPAPGGGRAPAPGGGRLRPREGESHSPGGLSGNDHSLAETMMTNRTGFSL